MESRLNVHSAATWSIVEYRLKIHHRTLEEYALYRCVVYMP